jgi:ankyrin repeat protein
VKHRIIILGKLALVLAMALPLFGGPGFPDWMTGSPSAQDRLFVAIGAGNLGRFDEALYDGASPTAPSRWDALPLGDAAGCGQLEMVRRLLAAGADINATDCNGMTPLMCAAAQDHVEIVELLIRRGADLSCRDSLQRSALEVAICSECPRTAGVLRLAVANSDL